MRCMAPTRQKPLRTREIGLGIGRLGIGAGRVSPRALARSITAEAAKPIVASRGEVARCIDTLRFSAAEARTLVGEMVAMEASQPGQGKACPGDYHCPGLNAAKAVDSFFKRDGSKEMVDVENGRFFYQASDFHVPGPQRQLPGSGGWELLALRGELDVVVVVLDG